MKKYHIKEGYILREIAGEKIIIPADPDSEISGMLVPNESAAMLWEVFQIPSTKEEAVEKILQEYDVEEVIAKNSVQEFVEYLLQHRMVEEEE